MASILRGQDGLADVLAVGAADAADNATDARLPAGPAALTELN
jgi:hypothetical protein